MIKFSTEQKIAIEMGRRARRRLIQECKRMAKRVTNLERTEYLDALIAGDSGVGKSFNILKTLRDMGIPFIELTGNISLFGLMGNLMLLHAHKPKGERVVVFLDDVDFMFEPKNINMLKHMTATQMADRKFEYTVRVSPKSFTETQQAVLPQYLKENGEHGLEIPCDEFIFVFASNHILAQEPDVAKMSESRKRKAQHELAIRGRFNPYDFKLNKEEKWGWLYDVTFNDDALHMLDNDDDKAYLLDWMWNNWDLMKETSVRTVQKMGYEITEDLENYKDNWEFDYLVNEI